jgi:hypothetical protein
MGAAEGERRREDGRKDATWRMETEGCCSGRKRGVVRSGELTLKPGWEGVKRDSEKPHQRGETNVESELMKTSEGEDRLEQGEGMTLVVL